MGTGDKESRLEPADRCGRRGLPGPDVDPGGTENYYFGDDKSLKNDVWSSADGKEWKLETAKAPWSPRAYHAAVVHAGKLWVSGAGTTCRSITR